MSSQREKTGRNIQENLRNKKHSYLHIVADYLKTTKATKEVSGQT
jgi:hypothetical protein